MPRSLALAGCFVCLNAAIRPVAAQTVLDVGLATPDTIAVEIREGVIERGSIVPYDNPGNHKAGDWIKTADGKNAVVIGPDAEHIRIADRFNGSRLDRTKVDNKTGYSIGGAGAPNVTAIYRKSVPAARSRLNKNAKFAPIDHFIFTKTDAPVPEGSFTIDWPDDVLRRRPSPSTRRRHAVTRFTPTKPGTDRRTSQSGRTFRFGCPKGRPMEPSISLHTAGKAVSPCASRSSTMGAR